MNQPEPRVIVAEVLAAHTKGAPSCGKLAQLLASDQASKFYTEVGHGFRQTHAYNLIKGYQAVRLFDRVLTKLGPAYTEYYVLDRVVLMLAIEVTSYCFDLKMMTAPILDQGANWQAALCLSNANALGATELGIPEIEAMVGWRRGFGIGENPAGWIIQNTMQHLFVGL